MPMGRSELYAFRRHIAVQPRVGPEGVSDWGFLEMAEVGHTGAIVTHANRDMGTVSVLFWSASEEYNVSYDLSQEATGAVGEMLDYAIAWATTSAAG